MALGKEVGLGPGDIVLDGDPTPPEKRAQPHPIFGPCLLWPNGWRMKMLLGTEVDLGPGQIVLDGDSAPPAEGAQQPTSFRPMSFAATVAHLSACNSTLVERSAALVFADEFGS